MATLNLWLRCSCWVRYGWDWSFYEDQCRGKASFVLTLVTEAVHCEVVSTHTLTRTAAGTLTLKMKCNHCRFCCSVAGTEYRHWCWFIQPTTEQFACLALSDDIAKHCSLTTGHTVLHLRGECRPGYLLSLRRGGLSMKMTPFVT